MSTRVTSQLDHQGYVEGARGPKLADAGTVKVGWMFNLCKAGSQPVIDLKKKIHQLLLPTKD